VTNGEEESVRWLDVRHGDCIKILKDETIPADCLALIASSPSGICYVETASLDGEKNLKPRLSNAPLQLHFNQYRSLAPLSNLTGRVICCPPSAELEAF
jgi:P-type E1-E2 ATPase